LDCPHGYRRTLFDPVNSQPRKEYLHRLPKLMGLKPPPSRGTFLDSVPVLELFMSGMAT
jgi:hypothetical protein